MIHSSEFSTEAAIDYALEQFKSHGWAVSVLLAVCKASGQNCEYAPRIASGLGGGLKVGEVCGAVTGGVMAIGLLYEDRDEVSARTKEFVNQFAERNGALRCTDILGFYAGSEEGSREYKSRNLKETCNGLVSSAVKTLLDLVKEWEDQRSV